MPLKFAQGGLTVMTMSSSAELVFVEDFASFVSLTMTGGVIEIMYIFIYSLLLECIDRAFDSTKPTWMIL